MDLRDRKIRNLSARGEIFAEGRTDRFKAIISGAPIIDQQSEYGTEGDSSYDRWFYGRPWG